MVFVAGLAVLFLGTAFSNGKGAGPRSGKVHKVFAVLLVAWLAVWALVALGSKLSSSRCETAYDGRSNLTSCN